MVWHNRHRNRPVELGKPIHPCTVAVCAFKLPAAVALHDLLPIDCAQVCMIYLDYNATTPVLQEVRGR
jgi:hypothetical protein